MSAMISEFKIYFNVLPVCLLGLICLTGCQTSQPEDLKKTVEIPTSQAKSQSGDSVQNTRSEKLRKTADSAPDVKKTIKYPGFQPTFQPPPEKNAFDYAYSIYRSSPAAPTGVYTYRGVVFVIVNLDTRKVKTRLPKGPAMLRAKKMLEKYYRLPIGYSLISRQIECRDFRKQKLFRYVLAYRESDILKYCQATQKE